jgi:septal ring factor EnvC (AmiA/AmiB activator)
MKVGKVMKNTAVIAVFALATAFISGCGGVSDAQMQQLNSLQSDVNSLQAKADSLKSERSTLEQQIAEKNAKLQDCNKNKEETKANLDKMSSSK